MLIQFNRYSLLDKHLMDAPEPMLRILRLSFEYWQRHPLSIAFILVSMLGITAIEVMLPVLLAT
ncbi:hypothetical protein AWV80_00470 [Cupriavidus sp. UYMU48A]|nr:hypothetical protein AWV80_00470 [Cupriavidus sp. UYMU48A]